MSSFYKGILFSTMLYNVIPSPVNKKQRSFTKDSFLLFLQGQVRIKARVSKIADNYLQMRKTVLYLDYV